MVFLLKFAIAYSIMKLLNGLYHEFKNGNLFED